MTEEQIKIECAKLDGWVLGIGKLERKYAYRGYDIFGHFWVSGAEFRARTRYTTSYDAIIPLIQKQDKRIVNELYFNINIDSLSGTPLQLATALIKAKGLWKD